MNFTSDAKPANDNGVTDLHVLLAQELSKMNISADTFEDAADILHDNAPNKEVKKVALSLLFCAQAMRGEKPVPLDFEGVF